MPKHCFVDKQKTDRETDSIICITTKPRQWRNVSFLIAVISNCKSSSKGEKLQFTIPYLYCSLG